MRYTYKKMTGVFAVLLGVMLMSRYSPDWLFYTVFAAIAILMLYLIYYFSSY